MKRMLLQGGISGLCALMLFACSSSGGGMDVPGGDMGGPDVPPGMDRPRDGMVGMDRPRDMSGDRIVMPVDMMMGMDMPMMGPNTANAGDPCDAMMGGMRVCPMGNVCIVESNTAVNGACAALGCTEDNPMTMGNEDNCGNGFACIGLQGGMNACIKECTPMMGGNDCGDPTVACNPTVGFCTGAC